jgi:hypothetical protein
VKTPYAERSCLVLSLNYQLRRRFCFAGMFSLAGRSLTASTVFLTHMERRATQRDVAVIPKVRHSISKRLCIMLQYRTSD